MQADPLDEQLDLNPTLGGPEGSKRVSFVVSGLAG
jgi:hypothetical protein